MTRASATTGPASTANKLRFLRDVLLELHDPAKGYRLNISGPLPLLPAEYARLAPLVQQVRGKAADGDVRALRHLSNVECLLAEIDALRSKPLPPLRHGLYRCVKLKDAQRVVRKQWKAARAAAVPADSAEQIALLEQEVSRDAERAAEDERRRFEREQLRAEYWRQIAAWNQALAAMRRVLGEDAVGYPARENISQVSDLAERADIAYRPPSAEAIVHHAKHLARTGEVRGDIYWRGERAQQQ